VEENETDKALKRLQETVDRIIRERETIRRIPVNKKTHRIRFEDEG
jgi:ribosomal protein S21